MARVAALQVTPDDAGVARSDIQQLHGGDAQFNAAAMQSLLRGHGGAYRDIVLLNAAAGLVIAGKAEDLGRAAEMAADAIDSRRALATLDRLIEFSQAA